MVSQALLLFVVVHLTLSDPLRIQPWSQDGRDQTNSNREYAFTIISGSSLPATYGYQLTSASCGTVYACPYDGSKAFTLLVFCAVGNLNSSTTDCIISLRLRLQSFYCYNLRKKGKPFLTTHAANNG